MRHRHSITSDLDLSQYHHRKVISSLMHLALQDQHAVALWKLPGQPDIHLVIDTSGQPSIGRIDLEEVPNGFIIAPYQNPVRKKESYLKADIYYTTNKNELRLSGNYSPTDSEHWLERFKSELQADSKPLRFYSRSSDSSSTLHSDYTRIVENGLESINQGVFQKVVPAALRRVKLSPAFNCFTSFEQLCESYPEAFVSLVSTHQLGTWLGTSPEALIEINRENIFSTVAVAGTQIFRQERAVQEVAWRQKEIEEQALVSRYIINCFKKIRLREFEELGPKTVVAGNLLHLKTTFTVDMEETNFPLLGSVMLDLLHPTSAVCGMPKDPAQTFLRENEEFDRELFSGYLGPVNMNEETHLFVNLRCMQILTDDALLYAGAGITEDSMPENEWIETQLKCDTLLDVLNL